MKLSPWRSFLLRLVLLSAALLGLAFGESMKERSNVEGQNHTAHDSIESNGGQIIREEVQNMIKKLKGDHGLTAGPGELRNRTEVAREITEDDINKVLEEEREGRNSILSEMFETLLEHEFDGNSTRSNVFESLVPLKKGEELSNVVVDESFLSKLNDLDWQITMEKMHNSIWYYWNNEFHREFVQRIPSALRQLRHISQKMGVSTLFEEGHLGDTINQLNGKTKSADRKLTQLFKRLLLNDSTLNASEIKYKRSEEAMINMVIELKGYIRIFLKLIDIKASQVGLLLLNKVQRKNYKKLSTNLNLFRSNIKSCPVHTAFSYRYQDENFDILMHHEKGFGIWNTGDLSNNNKKMSMEVLREVDEMINFIYNEFIAPIALIGSSIEDTALIHSSIIRNLWKNVSAQNKVPLYTIFESITKATFFFIKQINNKIYMVDNRQ
ncbi:signal peptide-containing protein [Cryptosporidium canis]|uniref:Signal peptide-containing protein n=1 Tax=Cryptosporidium canis TaxID=195482 RepID=A0ABQ8P495_9CRYT|nr:signal peptide-containing protein [Cryptosporidium canis]KAJ1606118.1 signal peptide-containing protein [Cryptosporidium canis]